MSPALDEGLLPVFGPLWAQVAQLESFLREPPFKDKTIYAWVAAIKPIVAYRFSELTGSKRPSLDRYRLELLEVLGIEKPWIRVALDVPTDANEVYGPPPWGVFH